MPEVSGESAVLVNPLKSIEIKDALQRLVFDEELRNELSRKGIKRAAEFSWENTASEVLSIYKGLQKT